MKKHVIWSSEIDLKDFEEYLKEEYPDVTDECEQYDICYNLNTEYLDDKKINLNIPLDNQIIIIADLGLWNGRRSGYRVLKNQNVNACFDCTEYESEFYCDRYDFKCTAYHHDGTNHYTFRVFKDSLSDVQKQNFIDKIYNNNFTQADITRCTKSLLPYIKKVYGF